jgi:hypothetical protein
VTPPKVVEANPEFGWINIDDTIWLAWQGDPGASNLFEVHHPVGDVKRKHGIGWIDLTSGTKHRLVSLDPLHIEASIGCHSCDFHGFVRNGAWVPA